MSTIAREEPWRCDTHGLFEDTGKWVDRLRKSSHACCESPSAPALLGAIRIDSDVPVSIKVLPVIRVETPLNHQGCIEATGPGGGRVDLAAEQLEAGNYIFRWTTSRGRTGTGPGFRTWVPLSSPLTVTLVQTNLRDAGDHQRQLCNLRVRYDAASRRNPQTAHRRNVRRRQHPPGRTGERPGGQVDFPLQGIRGLREHPALERQGTQSYKTAAVAGRGRRNQSDDPRRGSGCARKSGPGRNLGDHRAVGGRVATWPRKRKTPAHGRRLHGSW